MCIRDRYHPDEIKVNFDSTTSHIKWLANISIYPYPNTLTIKNSKINPTSMSKTESKLTTNVLIKRNINIAIIGSRNVSTGILNSFRNAR